MNYSEILEKYLYRIARDELSDISSVVPLLGKATVYVLGKSREDSSKSSVDLLVPLRKKNSLNLVPVFLDKTRNFQPQPYDSYELFEIYGESLLQVLPEDYGIIIEPMTSLEVIFSPEMLGHGERRFPEQGDFEQSHSVQSHSELGHSELGHSNNPEDGSSGSIESATTNHDKQPQAHETDIYSTSASKVRYLTPSDFKQQPRVDAETKDGFVHDTGNIHEVSSQESSIDDERIWIKPSGKKLKTEIHENERRIPYDIEERLLHVVKKFKNIQEAYSIPHKTPDSECVIGVLADPWSSDERFQLIESIANVSQEFYGYAGAVEVYDDLNDTHSRSWDLFKMISPFYSKDLESSCQSLSDGIQTIATDESGQNPGIKESVSKITKSGFRLFGR